MSIGIKVLFLLMLVCQVYTKPARPEKLDEKAEMNVLKVGDCGYNQTKIKEMHKTTKRQIGVIKKLMTALTKGHCQRRLQILDKKHLQEVLSISTTPHADNLDSITNTYFNVEKQVHLFKELQSKLASSVYDCCLEYPSKVHNYLKRRVLTHWRGFQSECGDIVVSKQCSTTLHVDLNGQIGCDNTGDMIYLLLKSTRIVLKDSLKVLHEYL